MDAVSVVTQLRRIAEDRNPSPDILSKIPRLAVGLSYFLEHPDAGVQHTAAEALIITCTYHCDTIVNSVEAKELRKNVILHSASGDQFLKDTCVKLISLLRCTNNNEKDKYREEEEEREKKCGGDNNNNNAEKSNSNGRSTYLQKEREIKKEENNLLNLEKKDDYTESTECLSLPGSSPPLASSSVNVHTPQSSPGDGKGSNEVNFPSSSSAFPPHTSSLLNSSSSSCGLNLLSSTASSSSSSIQHSSSFRSSNETEEKRWAEEGDVYTLVLGLKKLAEEDEVGWKCGQSFTTNLQDKIICVPGVISVTVNIRKKRSQKAENNDENNEGASDAESNKGGQEDNNPQETNLKKDMQASEVEGHDEEEKKNEKDGGNSGIDDDIAGINVEDEIMLKKVEVVAVVVIKIPFDNMKRKEILKKLRENYFILKIELMPNRRENADHSTPSFASGEQQIQNNEERKEEKKEETRKKKGEKSRRAQGRDTDDSDTYSEDNNSEDESERGGGGGGGENNDGSTRGEERGESDSSFSDLEEDELESNALGVDIRDNDELLAYLDEEEEQSLSQIHKNDKHRNDTNFNERKNWEESARGWSFFSRNSALFGESRYLSRSAIVPCDDDPSLIEKLQKEKERRAAERIKRLEKQNTLDRVLNGLSSIKFW